MSTPANGPVHFDPDELVRRLPGSHALALQRLPKLRQVLDAAYFLSLEAEERTPITSLVAVTDTRQTVAAEYRFEEPRPLEIQELRKLALACSSERACLHVEQGPNLAPVVVGIAGHPRMLADARYHLPLAFVEVKGPGHVSLAIGADEVGFDRTRYYSPSAPDDLAGALPPASVDAITSYLTEVRGTWIRLGHSFVNTDLELWERHRAALSDEIARQARPVLLENLLGLCRVVRRSERGGTLIFLGGPDADCEGVIVKSYSVTRQVHEANDPVPWNRGMLNVIAGRAHRALASEGRTVLAGIGRTVERIQEWGDGYGRQFVDKALLLWESDVQACADLCRIDGAVVFDRRHEPRHFGAKLHMRNAAAVKQWIESKGTRHLSTACTVATLPDALGITVSQDGSITLFCHGPDGVRPQELLL